MSFRQILASLTSEPARRFGHDGTSGRIAAGYHADLTVLMGEEFAPVAYTIRNGRIVYGSIGASNVRSTE